MKSDKRQTMILIGVALLAVAGVLLYISLSQPRVYDRENAVSQAVQSDSAVRTADTTAAQQETTAAPPYDYPINLNTATLDELKSIDGLGDVRAAAILEYRDYIGAYTDVSQIKNIRGISDAIYAEVAGYLTV